MYRSMLIEAWISIWAQKLRSFLTVLGIIIGVTSVVLMISVGQSSSNYISKKLNTLGNNLLVVSPSSTSSSGVKDGTMKNSLKMSDVSYIKTIDSIEYAAPLISTSAQVISKFDNWRAPITATTPDYLEIVDWKLENGFPFQESDLRSAAQVALIGRSLAKKVFVNQDPIGQFIRVDRAVFVVIGLLAQKGQSLNGKDQDDILLIPISTYRQKIANSDWRDQVDLIMIKASINQPLEFSERQVSALMREIHRIRKGAEDDFTVSNLTSIADTVKTITSALSALLAAISSISLLVGSIGIMNMMLVTVAERTREIGIRKAIGAPSHAIMLQFLLEAIFLSMVGSLIGLGIGVVICLIVNNFIDYEVIISAWSVVVTVFVAFFVGILSGFFPALKATRMRPIDALRHQ